MEIGALLNLAEAVLSENDPDELVEAIDVYSNAFSKWYEPEDLRGSSEELEELSVKHASIVEIMSELRDEAAQGLRNLKQKGRGILAYTDILPRKISFARTRKG